MLKLFTSKVFACGTTLSDYVTRYRRCWFWSYYIYSVFVQSD